jgi:hypothetical protein
MNLYFNFFTIGFFFALAHSSDQDLIDIDSVVVMEAE